MENHPNIVNVNSEQMKTLEALAKATMDASEAKNRLHELESKETEYLAEREGRAVAIVEKVLEDSEEVLNNTMKNYEAVTVIAATTGDLSSRVTDILGRVKIVLSHFDEKSRLWEAKAKATEERLSYIKTTVELQRVAVESKRISNVEIELSLVEWEKKLASQEEMLRKDIAELSHT